jgi:hypothetical protein
LSADHLEHDPVLAAIADLKPHDVSAGYADRLRSRCHGVLEERRRRQSANTPFARLSLRRVVVPALASAWCAVYLCEILLRAAAIYGF